MFEESAFESSRPFFAKKKSNPSSAVSLPFIHPSRELSSVSPSSLRKKEYSKAYPIRDPKSNRQNNKRKIMC